MKKVFRCGYSTKNRFGKQYIYSEKRYDNIVDALRNMADCYEKGRLNPEIHHPEFHYEFVEEIKPEE